MVPSLSRSAVRLQKKKKVFVPSFVRLFVRSTLLFISSVCSFVPAFFLSFFRLFVCLFIRWSFSFVSLKSSGFQTSTKMEKEDGKSKNEKEISEKRDSKEEVRDKPNHFNSHLLKAIKKITFLLVPLDIAGQMKKLRIDLKCSTHSKQFVNSEQLWTTQS